MNERWAEAANGLVADLQRIFSTRLRSVVVYGPTLDVDTRALVTTFVLVDSLRIADLEACAHRVDEWARAGIDTPLIVPDTEFRRSLDTFPVEYADLVATHVRVFGPDPFAGIVIDPEDLRRACEKQVKSHLLHLREGCIEAGGRPLDLAHLVAASAPAFGVLLRNIGRLTGAPDTTRHDAAMAGARATDLDESVVARVLSLATTTSHSADGARLFPDYLAAVEQVAAAIDRWHA